MNTSENSSTDPKPATSRQADPRVLSLAVEKVRTEQLLNIVLEAVPGYAMVLNEQRQIVAANRRLIELAGVRSLEDLRGKRSGDVMGCRNSADAPSGCGSGAACRFCGSLQAIVASQSSDTQQVRECRIPLACGNGAAFDAEVVASAANVGGMKFTIVAMRDISSEKRRAVLERVFFHDILNTAGGMTGLISVLREEPSADAAQEYLELLNDLCERLVDVIHQQRELLAAESGELATHPMFVSVASLVKTIIHIYEKHEVAGGRSVNMGNAPDVDVVTDVNLARRVLENMVKNALEAVPAGATVTIDAEDLGEEVAIRVHNPGTISEEVRHQIFQRSFSTKGSDRGLGTYSMRLLGEGYLGGEVAFTTNERGTTFVFQIPKAWKGHGSDEDW